MSMKTTTTNIEYLLQYFNGSAHFA